MNIALFLPLISDLLEKILPDKGAREAAKLELLKLGQSDVKEFHDFVVAYEGSGDKVHWVIQILRGSVRPVVTYFLVGLFAYGFLNPLKFNLDQLQMLFQLNMLTLAFWFGSKAVENFILNKGKMETKDRLQKLMGQDKVSL